MSHRAGSLPTRLHLSWRRAAILAPFWTRLDRAPGTAPMKRLHVLSNAYALGGQSAIVRLAARAAMFVLWPLISAALIVRQPRSELLTGAADAGVSPFTSRLRQWSTCVHWRIPIGDYTGFSLHRRDRSAQIGDYLLDLENFNLIAELNRVRDVKVLENKICFWEHCRSEGLAAIPILAAFERSGGSHLISLEDQRWRSDLIIKPVAGSGGEGVAKWPWIEGRGYRSPSGAILSLDEVLALLEAWSGRLAMMVQPCLSNDAVTKHFTNGSLATARVLTGRTAGGSIEVVSAFFRMPVGTSVADNFSAGGLMSVIDISTGRLGSGIKKAARNRSVSRHPDTGIEFAGEKVPQWSELCALSRNAHATLPAFEFVSWDCAATQDGPVLVEGNHHGGLIEFQGVNGRPLGRTRFAEVYLSHRGGVTKPTVK